MPVVRGKRLTPTPESGDGANRISLLRARWVVGVAAAPTAVREPRCSVTGSPRIALVTGSLCDLANWAVDVVIQPREDAGRVGVFGSCCRIRVRTASWRTLHLARECPAGAGSHKYCRRDSDHQYSLHTCPPRCRHSPSASTPYSYGRRRSTVPNTVTTGRPRSTCVRWHWRAPKNATRLDIVFP